MQGCHPHDAFEVVPNAITSHFPPDPNPGDDVRRRTTFIASSKTIGKPRTQTQPCQTPKHRTLQAATEKRGRYRCGSVEKLPRVCVK